MAYTASVTGDVLAWRQGKLLRSIAAHEGAIFCLHQSRNGFATGGNDGLVRLWQPDFKPIGTIDLTGVEGGYNGERVILVVNEAAISLRKVLTGYPFLFLYLSIRAPGITVRSVCWTGKNVYAGTKNSEIFLISNDNKQHPKVLVKVCNVKGACSDCHHHTGMRLLE